MAQILLSVVIDPTGTNYVTKNSKPLLKYFNTAYITDATPITSSTTLTGVTQVVYSDPNKNTSDVWKVAETVLQIATAGDITSSNGFSDKSANITAFATGGQASAVALANYFCPLGTVATAADSVKLPAVAANLVRVVQNNGVAAANVYPQTGAIIDSGAANAAVSLPKGTTAVYWSNGTKWFTVTA